MTTSRFQPPGSGRRPSGTKASRGLSGRVKFIYLLLAANGVPAFVLLTFASSDTDRLFVWTVKPPASAALPGVRHGLTRCQVLGVFDGAAPVTPLATIIAPARPEQRRAAD